MSARDLIHPLVCCLCGEPAEWRLLVRCEDIYDNYWDVFCSTCAVATPNTEIEEIEKGNV